MIPAHDPVRCRRGRAVAAVLGCLTVAATLPVCGGGEPGPVPLLREAVPADAATGASRPAPPGGLGDWRLVAVLGATFAVLVGARMVAGRRAAPPPPDVFEVLGSASLGGQHAVRIVRFGPKTLLVGVSSAGATTLAEIGDPQSTARIAAACRDAARSTRESTRSCAPVPSSCPGGPATEEAA